ncbi:MAG: acetyl-CoA carboxylase biotin carboxyl carrier protein subunit [Proteobacteria bacterium]|nr:acetyl-CoA carboxylase biotin carboxyl carrier protein subunit [Pseudomonadota bacterium]
MTGTVFRIETRVGADVEEGEELLLLESMKMEIPVEAPRNGRVAQIPVAEGQAVEEGDTLVVLD